MAAKHKASSNAEIANIKPHEIKKSGSGSEDQNVRMELTKKEENRLKYEEILKVSKHDSIKSKQGKIQSLDPEMVRAERDNKK